MACTSIVHISFANKFNVKSNDCTISNLKCYQTKAVPFCVRKRAKVNYSTSFEWQCIAHLHSAILSRKWHTLHHSKFAMQNQSTQRIRATEYVAYLMRCSSVSCLRSLKFIMNCIHMVDGENHTVCVCVCSVYEKVSIKY